MQASVIIRRLTLPIIGTILAVAFFNLCGPSTVADVVDQIIVLGYLIGLSSLLVLVGYRTLLQRRFNALPVYLRIGLFCAALIIGLTLVELLPLRPHSPLRQTTLTIQATGQRSAAAQAGEVWISAVRVDGQPVSLTTLQIGEGWKWRNEHWFASTATPEPVRWQGYATEEIEVEFISHPWSGQVVLRINEREQLIDLYSNTDPPARQTIRLFVPEVQPQSGITDRIFGVINVLAISLIVFAGMIIAWTTVALPPSSHISFPYRTPVVLIFSIIFVLVGAVILILLKLYPPTPDMLTLRMSADQYVSGRVIWNDKITNQQFQLPFNTLLNGQFDNPEPIQVSIEPTQERHPLSRGQQIWFYNIQTLEHRVTDPAALSAGSGWEPRYLYYFGWLGLHSYAHFGGQDRGLTYITQSRAPWVAVQLGNHPYSGKARLSVNGASQVVDLYGAGDLTVEPYIIGVPASAERLLNVSIPVYRIARDDLRIEFDRPFTKLQIHDIRLNNTCLWCADQHMIQLSADGQAISPDSDDTPLIVASADSRPHTLTLSNLPLLPAITLQDLLLAFYLTAGLIFGGWIVIRLLRRFPALLSIDIPLNPGPRPSRWLLLAFSAILIGILLLRSAFALANPILLHVDSGEYLEGGSMVYRALDYSRAGDWRLPGYYTFIALCYLLFGYSTSSIIIGQMLIMVTAIGLAVLLGRIVAGWYAGMFLSLFLALHPGILLLTNLVMTENLTLAITVPTIIAGWCLFTRPFDWRFAVLLGLCIGLGTLFRKNFLILGGVLLLFIVLRMIAIIWVRRQWRLDIVSGIRSLVGCAIVGAILLLPWMLRNNALYNTFDLLPTSERSRLHFAGQQQLLDERLSLVYPASQDYQYRLEGIAKAIYRAYSGRSVRDSEQRARAIMLEQRSVRPGVFLRGVAQSALYLIGIEHASVGPSHGINTTLANQIMFDDSAWNRYNQAFSINWLTEHLSLPPLQPVLQIDTDRFWKPLWEYFFRYARLFSSIIWGIALMCAVFLAIRPGSSRFSGKTVVAVLFFGTVYLGILAGHAINYAEHDRYQIPFEWIAVLTAAAFLPQPREQQEE